MAITEQVLISPGKRQGFVGLWLEKNEARIQDLRHSIKLFMKSPLAVIGFLIVVLFFVCCDLRPVHSAVWPDADGLE